MKGILLVNKPIGISSFQVIGLVRKLTKEKRVGHAGTLDPFASGLLVVAIGREYTKRLSTFQEMSKTYISRMVLGFQTDTLDIFGKIVSRSETDMSINENRINEVLSLFKGKYLQMPPQFSAKKVNGKRAYKLARKGEKVSLSPNEVDIHEIGLDTFEPLKIPMITFTVTCTKGTYIRSLIQDIGKQLKVDAVAKELIRLKIGKLSLDNALNYNDLSEESILKNRMSTW